jgi:hypothetical protein
MDRPDVHICEGLFARIVYDPEVIFLRTDCAR